MITVNNVSMNFSGQTLFKDVELKFVPGNCYGIIGANGAGKSTFLRILSGDLEPTTGEVIIPKEERMSILKQDHFQYDAYTVLDTVMMGNQRLYDVMKEKDALYEKEDFTDEDGVKASELEAEFAEMGGWEAESDVSRLIQGLGLSNDILYSEMSSLTAKEKVKVLLAQALFGKPDIILLDEPTNGLDPQGNEVISQDLDAITILDKFVREHPDFSPFGAKGCLSLTGYQGILGYRTQNDIDILKTAAIGVAMENALPEVKEIADFVTRSNENSGVAHAIHTFAL